MMQDSCLCLRCIPNASPSLTTALTEERVIQLYDGAAPGSENWKHTEREQHVAFAPGPV